MKLKVCGVNDAAFAVEAARLGADYLGFIFAPSSPRAVTPETARRIVRAVREAVPAPPRLVGVFVDQTVAEILSVLRTVGLDIAQLHRRATAADVAALRTAGREVWTGASPPRTSRRRAREVPTSSTSRARSNRRGASSRFPSSVPSSPPGGSGSRTLWGLSAPALSTTARHALYPRRPRAWRCGA